MSATHVDSVIGESTCVHSSKTCEQQVVRFRPGTTWLCFSDQVMHAAVSGQFMLEQTIHVPVAALYQPDNSPLAILQRLCGRSLLPAP